MRYEAGLFGTAPIICAQRCQLQRENDSACSPSDALARMVMPAAGYRRGWNSFLTRPRMPPMIADFNAERLERGFLGGLWVVRFLTYSMTNIVPNIAKIVFLSYFVNLMTNSSQFLTILYKFYTFMKCMFSF